MKLRHRFTGLLDLQRQADGRELQRMLQENFAELELRAGRDWVTELPKNPDDGAEVVYVVDASAGIAWPLRYDSVTGYWWPVGAAPLYDFASGAQSQTLNAYTAAAATPVVTLPLQGDYVIEIGGVGFGSVIAANYLSFYVGAAAPNDANAARSDGTASVTAMMASRRTGLAAGVALKTGVKNGSAAGTVTWTNRWIRATPIRVK